MKTLAKKYIVAVLLLILGMVKSQAAVFDNLQATEIVSGLQFTEGPVWHPNAYLVFCDVNTNTVYRWDETNGLATLVSSSQGAMGTDIDKANQLYFARQNARDIAKRDTNGIITSVLSTYNGKKFNSPNDLVLSYLGSVYFTDPDFGTNTSSRELAWEGLFCLPYNSTTPVLFDSTLVKPNGLTFSYDWRTLFVAESSTNKIYTYTLSNELLQANSKKTFLTVSGTGEIDGMTADVFGNLYVAFGLGGVKIYNKSATQVGSITLPAGVKVRNLCMGGKYNNILFITAGTSVYKVDIRPFGDFVGTGILSAPTDTSVILNTLSDKAMDAYVVYGTDSTSYGMQTSVKTYAAGATMNILLNGLNPNTTYYYQLKYKLQGASAFVAGTKGQFTTQRSKSSNFSFAIEADPHLDEASNYLTFQATLGNISALKPDFMIDLGDNFMTEKYPLVDKTHIEQRNLIYRNFWDKTCGSVPLYIVVGNHEGELGWENPGNTASTMYNLTTAVRKQYYTNPEPNGFYTGSASNDLYVGKRQNYYAWTWGDALFVVIDPYAYTTAKANGWSYTLGKTQYDWFRFTLEGSNAKYKFVFAHQLVGGDREGRGGSERAGLYENGGYNLDGSYGFDDLRPGWGKPLHQLMVENGVQIYFHGHDHLYAEQPLDGVVYQECPQPSFPGYTSVNYAASYGYVSGTIIPNSGHLQVTILGDSAKVDYVGGYHANNVSQGLINGQIRRTYYVKAKNGSSGIAQIKAQSFDILMFGDDLVVKSDISQKAVINIYNATGQKVSGLFSGTLSQGVNEFNLNNLSNGLYLIDVNTNDAHVSKKVIYTGK